jgi:LacI family transcriptional regulator
MAELAALAQCSVATVSRALRGSPLLPRATVERIRRLADEAGYQRNPLLGEVMRQMRTRRSAKARGNVAYLTAAPPGVDLRQHGTYAAFFRGASERAQELGFVLDDLVISDDRIRGARLTRMLKARGHRGLIIGPWRGQALGPADLAWEEFAAVKIGNLLPAVDLPRVGHYAYLTMLQALELCRQRGYRRPGLALHARQTGSRDRGWHAALAMDQQDHPQQAAIPPLVTEAWNAATFTRWYRRHRPDLVFALRQEVAGWLRAAGALVPEQVGFVHLDRCTETTDAAGIGRAAMDMLFGAMLNPEERSAARRDLLLQGGWVEGTTVRRP